jgi:hypothetical protein
LIATDHFLRPIGARSMSALGHLRQTEMFPALAACPLCAESGQSTAATGMSA